MQARGALMIEHRLIERLITILEEMVRDVEATHAVSPVAVDAAVDFIRTYADRTHHGKEEDIMFRDLAGRSLSWEHRRLMEDLIQEHAVARRRVGELVEASSRYRRGDAEAWADVAAAMRELVALYPGHIRKEDKVFFPAARRYVTEEEDRAMLDEFKEFDRLMIHEKYAAVVEALRSKL